MKKTGKTLGLALLFATVLGVVASSYASQPRFDPFAYELKPAVHPRSAGPVDMAFSFAPLGQFCEGCEELRVTVITEEGLEFLGESSWTVQADKDHPYSTILHVVVPRDDTCSLWVRMQCCRIKQIIGCYFVTIGDSVEYWTGNPRGYHPSPPPSKTNDPIRDTLTEEQLQTEYEVCLNLTDSSDLRIADVMIGPLSDSSKYEGRDGFYILWISLDNLFKLHEAGIDFEFMAPPAWSPEFVPAKDSVPKNRPKMDSAKGQSAAPTSPDGISLDSVVGMTTPGELPTGQQITFRLRLNNTTGDAIKGSSNGFRVYSPDGAQWGSFSADTLNLGWKDMFGFWYEIN